MVRFSTFGRGSARIEPDGKRWGRFVSEPDGHLEEALVDTLDSAQANASSDHANAKLLPCGSAMYFAHVRDPASMQPHSILADQICPLQQHQIHGSEDNWPFAR